MSAVDSNNSNNTQTYEIIEGVKTSARSDKMNATQLESLPDLDSLNSELLAVVTCRTVFGLLFTPKRKDDLPSMATAGAGVMAEVERELESHYNNKTGDLNNYSNSSSYSGSNNSNRKHKGVWSQREQDKSRDSVAVNFGDVCAAVGDAVNFEFNCLRVDEKAKAVQKLQTKFADNRAKEEGGHGGSLRTRSQ